MSLGGATDLAAARGHLVLPLATLRGMKRRGSGVGLIASHQKLLHLLLLQVRLHRQLPVVVLGLDLTSMAGRASTTVLRSPGSQSGSAGQSRASLASPGVPASPGRPPRGPTPTGPMKKEHPRSPASPGSPPRPPRPPRGPTPTGLMKKEPARIEHHQSLLLTVIEAV